MGILAWFLESGRSACQRIGGSIGQQQDVLARHMQRPEFLHTHHGDSVRGGPSPRRPFLLGMAFANRPKRGRIQGAHLLMLQGLVALLRDPSALMEHGQRIMEGHRPSDLLDALLRQDSDTEYGRITSVDEPEGGEDDMPDLGDDLALDAIPREVTPDLQPVLPNCGLW